MLRIRLRRTGAKKQPSYRVVVADQRAPRDGRFLEIIGHYNPRTEPTTFKIDEQRALHWLSQGAQPSEPVERLLRNQGTLDRFTRLRAGESLEDLLAEVEQEIREEAEEVKAAEVTVTEEEQPVAEETATAEVAEEQELEPDAEEVEEAEVTVTEEEQPVAEETATAEVAEEPELVEET